MSEYIDRDEILKNINNSICNLCREQGADAHGVLCSACRLADAITHIEDAPTVDVKPVLRGEWEITEAYPHNIYCSVCYKTFAQEHWNIWGDGSLPRNFCPNCGADMRGFKE